MTWSFFKRFLFSCPLSFYADYFRQKKNVPCLQSIRACQWLFMQFTMYFRLFVVDLNCACVVVMNTWYPAKAILKIYFLFQDFQHRSTRFGGRRRRSSLIFFFLHIFRFFFLFFFLDDYLVTRELLKLFAREEKCSLSVIYVPVDRFMKFTTHLDFLW